jgi:coenzyme F420-reducing hydrogenase beta subunit
MLAYKNKELCSGCTACMNICPFDAISMQPDREGFLYPVTDEKLCTDCALCQQICPFQNDFSIGDNYEQPKVYAAKHRDDNVRMNSSSGGMFTAISDYILSNNGIIYGAAFDEQFRVCHQKAENTKERDKFRGSKYVQSDLNRVFTDIKDELKKGRMVLFTGTPCQNAGLSAYLRKSYENLYLCDIVCHGVPSPLLWKKYVHFIEKRHKSKLIKYSFRYKKKGWRGYNVYAKFENGKSSLNTTEVLVYANLFASDLALRSSCYHCRFTNLHRPSDITIGDFWGIEKSIPEFEDNLGVSLVLINSPKGLDLFQKISSSLYYRESNTVDCLQRNLYAPSEPSPKREQFWKDYWDRGFEYVLKRYAKDSVWMKIKSNVIKPILKKLGILEIVRQILRQ